MDEKTFGQARLTSVKKNGSIKGALFVTGLVSILALGGCSTVQTPIPMQVPGDLGLTFTDLRIMQFDADAASRPFADQLTQQVVSGIGRENFISISKSAPQRLVGKMIVSKVETVKGKKERFKSEKVNGKRKLVSDGFDCVVTKTASVVGSYSVVAGSGQNYGGDSFSIPLESEGVHANCGSAQAELLSDAEMYQEGVDKASRQIVKAVSPYTITVKAKLMKGKSDDNKLGIDYFEDGLKEQAVNIWQQVALQGPNSLARSAAYHNIGIAYEAEGRLRDAFDQFAEANKISPREKLHRKALARVQERQKNANILN